MNSYVNTNAFGGVVRMSVSASRGILASQGIGLSTGGAFGADALAQAKAACAHQPNRVLRQDKPSGSWHPAAIEAAGAFAFDAGYEQAFVLPEISGTADMQAARLRTAHQATVIRNRRRCRSR